MKKLQIIILCLLLSLFSIISTYAKEEKTSKYRVSIIIIIDNTDKYLKQCLDSIVNQSLKKVEIFCVTNHTNDNISSIMKEYSKYNINLIKEKNVELASLINKAIKNAKGEYISFVDANDYFKQDAYKIAYTQAHGKDADILAFGYINNKAKKNSENNNNIISNNPFTIMKKLLLHGCTIWGKLYKTSLVKQTPFNEKLKFSQNVCFNYSIFPKAKIVISISDLLYYHRWLRYAVNTKTKDIKEKINNDIEVLRDICKNWRASDCAKGKEEVLYKAVFKNLIAEIMECDKDEVNLYIKEIKDIFRNDIFTKESLKKFPKYIKEKLKKVLGFSKKTDLKTA